MLPRAALPLFLLAAALAQEEAGIVGEAGQEEDAQARLEDRVRGERADGALPPPRRPLRRPGQSSGFGSFLSGKENMCCPAQPQ